MKYDHALDTYICDMRYVPSTMPTAIVQVGAKRDQTQETTFDGRWVKTLVLIRPKPVPRSERDQIRKAEQDTASRYRIAAVAVTRHERSDNARAQTATPREKPVQRVHSEQRGETVASRRDCPGALRSPRPPLHRVEQCRNNIRDADANNPYATNIARIAVRDRKP